VVNNKAGQSYTLCRSLCAGRNTSHPRSEGNGRDELGADMHVLSCDAAAARNLMLAVERSHLTVDAMVATPYAAGLAALADDEAELGAALIDMGAGTTSVSIFSGGHLSHVDGFAVGGNHVTMDVARALESPRGCRTVEDALWRLPHFGVR